MIECGTTVSGGGIDCCGIGVGGEIGCGGDRTCEEVGVVLVALLLLLLLSRSEAGEG